jgi:hypothetical protein
MDCVQGVYHDPANRAALAALFGPAPSVSALNHVRSEDCRGVAAGGTAYPRSGSPARPPRSRMVVSVETLKRKGCATRGG